MKSAPLDLSELVTVPFRLASRIRQASIFHPRGVLFHARLTRVAADDDGLPLESADVTARLSLGIGLSESLPDVGGLAIAAPLAGTVPSRWDILLAGSGPTRVGRTVPWPSLHWNDVRFSTLMPLSFDDRSWWLAARITTPLDAGLNLRTVSDALERTALRIEISQAEGGSAFRPLALLESTGSRLPSHDHPGFDPAINSPAAVRPQPEWLRKIRLAAYRQSRTGRPDV